MCLHDATTAFVGFLGCLGLCGELEWSRWLLGSLEPQIPPLKASVKRDSSHSGPTGEDAEG